MAEGIKISELVESTEAAQTDFIPIDDGTLTKKISIQNFNDTANTKAQQYAQAAQGYAEDAEDAKDDVTAIASTVTTQLDTAQGYVTQANSAKTAAQTAATNASTSANSASQSASLAASKATTAQGYVESAQSYATQSRSWAEGGTGERTGEDTNNAKYWAQVAAGAAGGGVSSFNGRSGIVEPATGDYTAAQVMYDSETSVKDKLDDASAGGSIITITTTESELYGQDVTISDGETTFTETFDNSGVAVFDGVTIVGTLTITSTDGTDTATTTLDVPYFGNYSKSLAFWSATIAVTTTTSQFDGLTVYAKKNGTTMGSAVFSNGSANITVPEIGNYILEVTLSWKTYESNTIAVSEETTYNATINGFIATISLTTPTAEFYSQNIAVTVDGTGVTGTSFDASGEATFTALQAGTYIFTLTYGGEPYTATVIVSEETSYSAVIKMWTATISVATTSTELYGATVTVSKDGAVVTSGTFDNTGSVTLLVHETGTFTVSVTYDDFPYSQEIAVSQETTYSTTLNTFDAPVIITTTSTEFYGLTITVTKGGSTVGTTTFSNAGSASCTAHETGEFTFSVTYGGEPYTSSVTVTEETTYSVTLDAETTITVTLYSAASDTVSYTDANGAQTATTDSSGQLTNLSISLGQNQSMNIAFTSSVAKDPSDLTADYSKTVTLTAGTTEVYVMPDNAIYWYGWENVDLGTFDIFATNGTGSVVKNTNNVYISGSGWNIGGTNKLIDISTYSNVKWDFKLNPSQHSGYHDVSITYCSSVSYTTYEEWSNVRIGEVYSPDISYNTEVIYDLETSLCTAPTSTSLSIAVYSGDAYIYGVWLE